MKKLLAILFTAVFTFSAFAADGDLDTSFGTGGFVNETFYNVFLSRHNSVVIQPDDKIIGAGQSINSSFFSDFTLVRYNPNGTPDESFGTGGKLYADVGGRQDTFPVVLLQPGGKIVLVGISKNEADRNVISIFRFNSNGTTDASFGTNGVALSAFTTSGSRGDTPNDAVIQPDGKIVVTGGWQGTAFCVGRFNSNGTVDSSFGTDGSFCAPTSPAGTGLMNSIDLQSDGKIVVSGSFTTSFNVPFNFIVFRFNANGSLDTGFDGDGYAITDFDSSFDEARSVHVLPNGKILAIGRSGINGSSQYNFGLARYNANGSLDTTFDGDGKAVAFADNTPGSEDYSSVVQANGKIVVGRYRTQPSPGVSTDGQLARFNADGSVDASFGAGGLVTNSTLKEIRDVALQSDGKIIAVGWNQSNFSITARFNNTDSASPVNNSALRIADFDGDGKTDASVFRNGTWFINPSSAPSQLAPNAFYSVQFGLATDKLAPADYDGDGKTDVAVWRESEGNFYILQSSNNSVRVENFGLTGDVLTVGDYDGDGKADLSVYREGAQSYFYYRASANNPNGNVTYLPWGIAGDKAVRGDFDGDAKLDAAIYRASNQTWYIRNSSNGQITYTPFGLPTEKRISADYDGDGKTDFAVWRDGIYYVVNSGNSSVSYQNFGTSGDQTVASAYVQ